MTLPTRPYYWHLILCLFEYVFTSTFFSVPGRKEDVFYREAHSLDFVGCIPVATSEHDSEWQSHSEHRQTQINW